VIRLLLALLLLWPIAATADCAPVTHRDRAFTICTAELPRDTISIHLRGPDGAPLGDFGALERAVDRPIRFAMNAGMYHADRRPVGLYVEGGEEVARIVTRGGPGNFGMLPNGVFCVGGGTARVIESMRFAAGGTACDHATQSGPMLVIDGALHPRFLPDSPSRKFRNAVGAEPGGTRVHFVISEVPVTFHEIATLYRDVLGVHDALYLDGTVSRLYVPEAGRSDPGRPMGPIVAVTRG
jgi:uncharacterized protein YigE (DUF2233 family)